MTEEIKNAPRDDKFAFPYRGNVLLVDEDRSGLHYYSLVFGSFGCQVQSCGSYQEAARLLNSRAFDLIIVSQGSPRFEGRCVLERAIQIDRRLRVLVVARNLDIPCYIEAMQLGAVDYLAEPVTEQDLKRVADTHLPLEPLRARSTLKNRQSVTRV